MKKIFSLIAVSTLMSVTATAKPIHIMTPGVPAALTTQVLGNNAVKISWQDTSTNENRFEVVREMSVCYADPDVSPLTCSLMQTFSVAANSTEFTDSTIPGGMTVTYYVRACDAESCTNGVTSSPITMFSGNYSVAGRSVDNNFNPLMGTEVTITTNPVSETYGTYSSWPADSVTVKTFDITSDFTIGEIGFPHSLDFEMYSGGTVHVTVSLIHPDGTTAVVLESGNVQYYYPYGTATTVGNSNSPLNVFKGKSSLGTWQIKLEVTSSGTFDYRSAYIGSLELTRQPQSWSTATDSNGYYSIAALPLGRYIVSGSKAGYSFANSPNRAFDLRKDATRIHLKAD
jgi:hypothetical protein